jgi:hypothetical protein
LAVQLADANYFSLATFRKNGNAVATPVWFAPAGNTFYVFSAGDAGKKAFITNRIGDWGFVLGMFLIYYTFGTLDFRAVQNAAAAMPIEHVHFGVLSFICLFLFIGATGKSAQIPLYVWLPDAMEGPTPVSALIHAATMVTAGVYMLGRNAVLLSHAPQVMTIVAIVGVLTALMAASIGLVQYDIKRVLAYSTVSQLGYMFTAMGVGAFSAGAFHLMTHAFFKALLFLGSCSVIHAMGGEQDMRRMGNLRKYMPVTFATMMIGTLAIAGIPPFAGFFSKDEILFRAFLSNKIIWVLAVATALMTAFYMWRLMAMTFFGAYRGPAWETHGGHDAHGHAAHAHDDPHAHDAHGHAAAHDDHGGGHGHGRQERGDEVLEQGVEEGPIGGRGEVERAARRDPQEREGGSRMGEGTPHVAGSDGASAGVGAGAPGPAARARFHVHHLGPVVAQRDLEVVEVVLEPAPHGARIERHQADPAPVRAIGISHPHGRRVVGMRGVRVGRHVCILVPGYPPPPNRASRAS